MDNLLRYYIFWRNNCRGKDDLPCKIKKSIQTMCVTDDRELLMFINDY